MSIWHLICYLFDFYLFFAYFYFWQVRGQAGQIIFILTVFHFQYISLTVNIASIQKRLKELDINCLQHFVFTDMSDLFVINSLLKLSLMLLKPQQHWDEDLNIPEQVACVLMVFHSKCIHSTFGCLKETISVIQNSQPKSVLASNDLK